MALGRGNVIIICCSLTEEDALAQLEDELREVERYAAPDARVLVAFTKSDMIQERKISSEEIQKYLTNKMDAYEYEVPAIEVTINQPAIIKYIFEDMVKWLISREPKES
mmetsp:Transcript_28432/g.31585  ORF Transcript_28432/g.31585 Transcript_28432/m.31585 type:complete len:109 (+) Transcript_28432:1590-1916(+)